MYDFLINWPQFSGRQGDAWTNQFMALFQAQYMIIGIVLFSVSIGAAIIYFYPYNRKPGYHYRPKYWLIWLAIAVTVSFIFPVIEYGIMCSNYSYEGQWGLYFRVASINVLYSTIAYLVVSLVICQWLPNSTNAYPLIRFGKNKKS